MRKAGVLIAVITLLICCASYAPAQETRPAPSAAPPESIHYGWADVLRVDPIYDNAEQAPVEPPHEECYEQQTEQPPPPPDNRAGATVLGAIVGGVIGHSIGRGHGRSTATAAGVVAGAAIGNSVAAQADQSEAEPPEIERHCRIVESPPPPRHVIAYDVEYRYRGELYMSRMKFDPGDRVRVRVIVTPAE